MPAKNCLNCKYEPEWCKATEGREGDCRSPEERKRVFFPKEQLYVWKTENAGLLRWTGNKFVSITNCPAWREKDA